MSVRTSEVKSKHSPRSNAATAGVFGDDTPDKGAERAAKIAYQEELKKQVNDIISNLFNIDVLMYSFLCDGILHMCKAG